MSYENLTEKTLHVSYYRSLLASSRFFTSSLRTVPRPSECPTVGVCRPRDCIGAQKLQKTTKYKKQHTTTKKYNNTTKHYNKLHKAKLKPKNNKLQKQYENEKRYKKRQAALGSKLRATGAGRQLGGTAYYTF